MSAITDMSESDTQQLVVDDDGAQGPLEKLLINCTIYQLEVVINDACFVCHAFPFPQKSSYFRDAFKQQDSSSNCTDRLRVDLPNLPGGCRAFKSIRSFCYDSRIAITKENVLDLLSASKFLGFTEGIARDNLYKQCHSFLEMESGDYGVPGIFTMLKFSTTDDTFVRDYDFLFKAIAKEALAYQDTDDAERRHKICGLLLELAKLKPWFVEATLQEFDRLGVYMIEFFWHKDSPSSLDILLTDVEEGLSSTNKQSIFSYFIRNLDVCIDAKAVAIGMLDPKKLVKLVLAPPLEHMKGSLKSESVIKAYIASQLSHLEATDIKNLPGEVILELVNFASRKKQELQHLAGVIDQVLLEEAQECPWDGSMESKLKFQQLAECIDRPSHDTLHDAVACFARLKPTSEATELWSMVDTEKLSSTKFESAVSLSLSQESSFTARLLRRLTDEHTTLKRKLSSLEKPESKRRSRSEFTIFVRALDGRTLCVLVQAHTTVFSIMEGIKNQGNIQCKRPWCLTYQQKNLNETLPIASYGIEKDCTLCMKVLYADGERGDQPIWDEDLLQGRRC